MSRMMDRLEDARGNVINMRRELKKEMNGKIAG